MSAQRQPLLFQHLYLSYVLFHVLTLSPKDGRAAALYGKDPYGMSSESTALYIGITSLLKYFAEPFVLLLKTADFWFYNKCWGQAMMPDPNTIVKG